MLEAAVGCGDLGEREGQVTCRSHAVVVGEPVVTGERAVPALKLLRPSEKRLALGCSMPDASPVAEIVGVMSSGADGR
ncbi:hypothetical protein GCM10010365_20290 [Streptomyces poonensis]|uniref:Uncharacterized protein n=1 Tax=Streptomyces poonensis TaxID=68255 RepID=A0A918PDK6_9ACTN|nr:hypothetical protein GCM10010365_20290 [Streptomyces poonensis]GLJ90357.1 hypothetical protein GCM10017589_29600 [Streptomyces poonensis]